MRSTLTAAAATVALLVLPAPAGRLERAIYGTVVPASPLRYAGGAPGGAPDTGSGTAITFALGVRLQ